MGLAFTDELIANQPNARVVLVDNRSRVGGHWNSAYDFVGLHQPSHFYGVNSEKLEKNANVDNVCKKRFPSFPLDWESCKITNKNLVTVVLTVYIWGFISPYAFLLFSVQ